jgi:hypothetical protein
MIVCSVLQLTQMNLLGSKDTLIDWLTVSDPSLILEPWKVLKTVEGLKEPWKV